MNISKLISIIESLLFVSGDEIKVSEIIKIINKHNDDNVSRKEVNYCLERIKNKFDTDESGIRVILTNDSAVIVANNENQAYIDDLVVISRKKTLTQAAIETLTIVAYHQPITKLEIEEIRGVKSDRAVSTLVDFEMIEEAGRLDKIGRPILYRTTNSFLMHFGFKSLSDLPQLSEKNDDENEEK